VLVRSPKNADIVAYSSCACCKSHEEVGLKRVKRIQAELSPNSRLVVWGCLPKICHEKLARIFRGVTFGPEPEKFNDIIPHRRAVGEVRPLFSRGDSYIVKIADGCLGECTFCAVRNARGPLKSRSIPDIVREVKDAVAHRHGVIVLQASDIACYGRDLRTDLIALLTAVDRIKGKFHVKLGPLCPNFLKPILPEFIALVKKKRFVKILQLDVESGSDRILRLMKRHYCVNDVRHCVKELNAKIPELIILSNFIVGFHSEREDDFQESVSLVKELGIVPRTFKFDTRPLTGAARLPNHVPSRIINRRYRSMKSLEQKLQSVYSRYLPIETRSNTKKGH
jgi:threonylcarbamoyladenosine tRNA methylthiotransferase CDKAL1